MWTCDSYISMAGSTGQRTKASTHVLERVDALGGLLNLAANDLGNELGGKLGEGAA